MTAEANERCDLDLTGITTAEIATFNGDISVAADATRARLEANIGGDATYTIEQIGTLLYIVGKKQGSSYANSGVTLRLWLPPGLKLKLATVNGAIQVKGHVSRLEAATTNGAITTVATGTADMRLTASSGAITVRGADGALRLVTSRGEIHLENAGGQIHAATSQGRIRCSKVTGQIRADTSQGEVRFDDITGQVRLSTSDGEIRIANASGQIQAATSNGNVLLDHVSFVADSHNWVRTSNGAVEICGMAAPGGLRLHAKGHKGSIRADLSGYVIQLEHNHLRAALAGAHPAQLEIAMTKNVFISAKNIVSRLFNDL